MDLSTRGRATLAVIIGGLAAISAARAEPLVLREQGSFFVGGRTVQLSHPTAGLQRQPGLPEGADPPGSWRAGQAYVAYQIPEQHRRINGRPVPPIVLIHGCCLTGKTWETTPDGREGWATYFVRRGFPVYVVDQVGRGRSGFNPEKLNAANRSSGKQVAPPALGKTAESAWRTFRIGPSPGVLFPGAKFPMEAQTQFFDQVVPDLNNWADGDQNLPTVQAMHALLDRIGPAVVVVHSQSSRMGWGIVEGRPGQVRGLIQIEGACTPDRARLQSVWRRTALVSVWGDYVTPELWGEMQAQCEAAVGAIRAAGGDASMLKLGEAGLPGHGHMLMQDRDNLRIADRLIAWIENVLKRSSS